MVPEDTRVSGPGLKVRGPGAAAGSVGVPAAGASVQPAGAFTRARSAQGGQSLVTRDSPDDLPELEAKTAPSDPGPTG